MWTCPQDAETRRRQLLKLDFNEKTAWCLRARKKKKKKRSLYTGVFEDASYRESLAPDGIHRRVRDA